MPLPTPPSKRKRCMRKPIHSQIVTDSPIKYKLITEHNARRMKKELSEKTKERRQYNKIESEVRKRLNVTAGPKKNQKKAVCNKRNNTTRDTVVYLCPLCQESSAGTTEAWTQCSMCSIWSHEKCADADRNGSYLCFSCAEKKKQDKNKSRKR